MLVGRRWGRRKLMPSISPNKTVEGAVAGVVAGFVFGLLLWVGQGLPPVHASILALSVAAAGQVGDLVESQFKRMAGVKDSGGLIPGHGGILDRIDSLLFPPAIAFLYLSILGLT
jgi:phosphatidate cytidylyltransferase